jgi:hypothetical protein
MAFIIAAVHDDAVPGRGLFKDPGVAAPGSFFRGRPRLSMAVPKIRSNPHWTYCGVCAIFHEMLLCILHERHFS